ncbi:MAG: enoyl-CoA hydratase/isomerase family protein [bacterium]|nr:enoyl-CoA hydratase/isomerase family protein [bacterium]
MSESLTRLERSDGVAVLTLDRPAKRNALSRALREELISRLDALAKDEGVSSVILTGAGPVFCAGFDRSEFAGNEMAEVFSDAVEYHDRVYTFAKPLVAAVNGAALGGGCDLAAMCDLRIAARTAVFGQPQVRFGAAAAYDLMREVMPTGPAREMCLTGRPYSSEEALSIGLVNAIHEPEVLLDAARELASSIATLPDGLPAETKRQFLVRQPLLFAS